MISFARAFVFEVLASEFTAASLTRDKARKSCTYVCVCASTAITSEHNMARSKIVSNNENERRDMVA